MEKAIEEYKSKGIEIAKEPFQMPDGRKSPIWFKDPDGLWIASFSAAQCIQRPLITRHSILDSSCLAPNRGAHNKCTQRTINESDLTNFREMTSELGPLTHLSNFLLNIIEKLINIFQF